MHRYLYSASNSRSFQQPPQPWGFPFSRESSGEFHAKSLFRDILSINHLDRIFCGESFPIAVCFQYFASTKGRGRSRTTSLMVPRIGDFLGAAPLPSLVRYIRNLLCVIGTLVYGHRFTKIATIGSPHQKLVATAQNPPAVSAYLNRGGCRIRATNSGGEESCPDRVLNWDGPFQYSGRERNSKGKFICRIWVWLANRAGRVALFSLRRDTSCCSRAFKPRNTTVLKQSPIQHSSVCSP